ncbi:class IV lanthionine synthetase LanL [Streptomyces sp. NPDC048172]|uniref:class IV lanthionine synthetase LanL n=1 Tax=Streptomyces sp. NPDC048172 TaxID=3365505 RepID=UPI003723C2AB
MDRTDWDAETFLRSAVDAPRDTSPDTGHSLHADASWVTVVPTGVPLAEHGWKLHVSTRAATFPQLLETVVPVLLAERVHFKVARSSAVLARLNQGQDQPAAVGKAVTVYPDPGQVRELGLSLAALLRGHEGPPILSDRRVAPDAPVHYRYGPFAARWRPGPRGSLALRVAGPGGELFDGAATMEYRRPSWATDPFTGESGSGETGTGDGADGTPAPEVLGERYRVTRGIYQAAHGNVFRAVDTGTGRDVVVKQARAFVGEAAEGNDSRTRIRNERRVLEAARGTEGIPEFLDHFAHGDDEFLVTNDAGSRNLLVHVRLHGSFMPPRHTPRGTPPPEFRALMTDVARTLTALHDKGVVMRDVTPRNIVLGEDRAVLIDFGIAALDGIHLPGGTAGFAPARQLRDEPPLPDDDCFALGTTLFYAATGMLPPLGVTVPGLARERMLQALTALHGDRQAAFTALLADLLSDEPGTARAALRALAAGDRFTGPQPAPVRIPLPGETTDVRPAELAERALETLLGAVEEYQLATPPNAISSVDASVYTGSAGIGLELLHHRHKAGVPELLPRLAAHAVAASRRIELAPGLYTGATGIGLFCALLRDAGYEAPPPREAADPEPGDDIMSGAAGIGLGHLHLADLAGARGDDRTGSAAHLDAARACAEPFLDPGAVGELRMTVSADSGLPETAGVDPAFGYAHGAAGIVDFLLALAVRTGDEPIAHATLRHAKALAGRAAKLTAASEGPSAVPISASWCQGLAGASRTLHRAGRHFDDPELITSARAAAFACAAWVPRMENLAQCCGAVGVGTALLEIGHAEGDARLWEAALDVAQHLLIRSPEPDEAPAFIALDRQDAPLSWGMGVAGVLTFLRRLSDPTGPDILPDVLPRAVLPQARQNTGGSV